MTPTPSSVYHDLITAGAFIGIYTDVAKMFEFVAAAVTNVPGVVGCEFVGASDEPAMGDEPLHPGATPAEPDGAVESQVIDIRTMHGSYGRAILHLDDRSAFSEFETAVHNFASSIALRLENLDHQARLEEEVARARADTPDNSTAIGRRCHEVFFGLDEPCSMSSRRDATSPSSSSCRTTCGAARRTRSSCSARFTTESRTT
ncbi:MAG: hypothetical protein ACOC37_04815 [Spirochaetota bacterium]